MITEEAVNKSQRQYTLTNEIFKDHKELPESIKNHPFFSKPLKINKIFPTIGLANFKEECDIAAPLLDLKKDNYVSQLVGALARTLDSFLEIARQKADTLQFLTAPANEKEEEELNAKLDTIYNVVITSTNLRTQIDVGTYQNLVQQVDGKIVLRSYADILDGNGKVAFKTNTSVFKLFAQLKEKYTELGLEFFNIDQLPENKIFAAENVPNKKYSIIFHSTGKEGAWDILTMSMRGIKSCQRWGGEFERCLIGSILSKYVGIIYLTSGSDIPHYGPKMMRRCLVRYGIDTSSSVSKPCILIDRMYPEVNEETLKSFTKSIQSKCSLPVHYAPDLQTSGKIKFFYVPMEARRAEMSEKDWSYQDTPLKTDLDIKLHIVSSAQDEDLKQYVTSFKNNIQTYAINRIRDVLNGKHKESHAIVNTLSMIRLHSTVNSFVTGFIRYCLDNGNYTINYLAKPRDFWRPQPGAITSVGEEPNPTYTNIEFIYKRYLLEVSRKIKANVKAYKGHINTLINDIVVSKAEHSEFIDFMTKIVFDFLKQELKQVC